jgi:hypothetical protein
MAEGRGKMNLTETKEGGKASHKSTIITITPTRGTIKAVTLNEKHSKV